MREKVHIKASHILMASAIIMIYFQIYWHYWFVKLLGGYVVNTLLPITVLFCGFVFKEFILADWNGRLKRSIFYLSIPLLCYVFFASVSIALNEDGLNNIKRFFIYIYSPVIIFLGLLGLNAYRGNRNIKFVLFIVFMTAVAFSVYAVYVYSNLSSIDLAGSPANIPEILGMPALETNRGTLYGHTGGVYGVGDVSAFRYTIPGISSTTYGPLLVPVVFIGLLLRKGANGISKHLYAFLVFFLMFCIFKTASRAAFVSLAAGITYLLWMRWFKPKELVLIITVLIISILTFGKLLFLRVLITFAAFFPIDISYLGNPASVPDITKDWRILSISETLSYIYQNPFFGIGMSNLIDIQEFSHGKEHNNYLSIAASFGMLSLIFYIVFIILLFIMVHKLIKKISSNKSMRDMGIAFGAGLLALIVYLNFAPAEFHFIWVWFGLSAAWIRNCKTELSLNRNITGEKHENSYN